MSSLVRTRQKQNSKKLEELPKPFVIFRSEKTVKLDPMDFYFIFFLRI